MTRVQMYKQYREEIAKASKLGESVKTGDECVIKYTKAINKINPAILNTIKDKTLDFEGGVINFDVSNKQIPQDVVDLFHTLNQAAINNKADEINNFFHSNVNHSILNDKNEIDKNWLQSNKDYSQLVSLNSDIGDTLVDEKEFVTDLTDKYNKMSKSNQIAEVKKLEEIKVKTKNNVLTKAMIAICCITIVMLLVFFALIIVKGIKG